jgi:hypothetical protein
VIVLTQPREAGSPVPQPEVDPAERWFRDNATGERENAKQRKAK